MSKPAKSHFLSASKKQFAVLEKLILSPGYQVGRASILSTDKFSTIVDLKGVPEKGMFSKTECVHGEVLKLLGLSIQTMAG